jgi:hypothetical protein
LARNFRQLPRPVKRLAYAIGFVTLVELGLLALGLWAGGEWAWLTLQLWSLSVGPLTVGVLVVLVVGIVGSRRRQAPTDKREAATEPEVPYEIAAARSAAQLLGTVARHPQGKQAVRRAARLLAAARAAAQSETSPRQGGGDQSSS